MHSVPLGPARPIDVFHAVSVVALPPLASHLPHSLKETLSEYEAINCSGTQRKQ